MAGIAVRRTAVIRNGVPMPHGTESIQRLRTPGAERKRFLLLTRLTIEKGVRVVIRAVAMLPQHVRLRAGDCGARSARYRGTPGSSNDPRIRFVGYVTGEAKEALLASAHYLLVPSLWYENAPVAVIEAAAYGLGVIASRIGGLPELIREGRTGLLFEPGDAAGLAATMQGLLDGRLALRDLARESRALADEHAVERMVDAYIAEYASLLASRQYLEQSPGEVNRAA